MAQAARDREDYTHPEKIYKDLVYINDGKVSRKDKEKLKGLDRGWRGPENVDITKIELCWSCGWNAYHECTSSYASRIRIMHTRHNTGIWEAGSRWLIRDAPNDSSLGNDFITQEFLRNHQPALDIPLIKEMRKLSEPTDKVDLTLMSRAQGVPLDTIWHTLSSEQKLSYKDQLGNAIRQLRQFTSPVAQNVNGGLLEDGIIGNCLRRRAPTCKKIGRTTNEWFDNLKEDLLIGLSRIHKTKDPMVIKEKYQELTMNFPKSEPYVLTHGDLNFTNIIVKDDKIEAIIDWEHSGYFPWWAERWLSLIGGNNQTDELFEPLWADIGLEMDKDTFKKEVIHKVSPVIQAWTRIEFSKDLEHPHKKTRWQRPGFCKCKPYAGSFDWQDIGNQLEHIWKDDVVIRNQPENKWEDTVVVKDIV